MKCRFCASDLTRTFVDLGMQPLANSYLDPAEAGTAELFFPLHVRVCEQCFLVQLPELASAEEIFRNYAYLSSVSTTWREHCRRFVAEISRRFPITSDELVVEVGSNDGCLLKLFVDRGQTVLGIEPAANLAAIAGGDGVPTLSRFFGHALADELAGQGRLAKLIIGNNVLAHVPDINDFVKGLRRLLAANGVVSLEFHHVLQLIRLNQFDTIYHEHFSYLSLITVSRILAKHGLRIFDADQLSTHGGSLRILACRDDDPRVSSDAFRALVQIEVNANLNSLDGYASYTEKVQRTKWSLLELLIGLRRRGARIVGYGAPAKGNTLLNHCGVRSDLIEYTVDQNSFKQGKLLPGTRIPIRAPDAIMVDKPEYVLILPWSLEGEITAQMAAIKSWGGRFIVPIPDPRILD